MPYNKRTKGGSNLETFYLKMYACVSGNFVSESEHRKLYIYILPKKDRQCFWNSIFLNYAFFSKAHEKKIIQNKLLTHA